MTTALIVDDSKLARIVVRKALAELKPDWKCVEATNATEAMVIAAFIDYNVAGKNGLELLEPGSRAFRAARLVDLLPGSANPPQPRLKPRLTWLVTINRDRIRVPPPNV